MFFSSFFRFKFLRLPKIVAPKQIDFTKMNSAYFQLDLETSLEILRNRKKFKSFFNNSIENYEKKIFYKYLDIRLFWIKN